MPNIQVIKILIKFIGPILLISLSITFIIFVLYSQYQLFTYQCDTYKKCLEENIYSKSYIIKKYPENEKETCQSLNYMTVRNLPVACLKYYQ